MKKGKKRVKKKEGEIKPRRITLKRVVVYFSPIVFFSLLFVAFFLVLVPDIELVGGEVVTLGAHRGDSLNHIENTMPAFKSALEQEKYNFIEFDIQYTKDKQIIVHHDLDLWRLQKKRLDIADLNYEELNTISSYEIPLYTDVMDLLAGKKPLNIEIKSQGNTLDDQRVADFVIQDCINRGNLDDTLISAISSDVLIYIHKTYPQVKTGKIYYVDPSTFLHFETFTSKLYNELERTNADYLMLHGSNLRNYESLNSLLPENKTLVIWYFTDEMYIVAPEFISAEGISSVKPRLRDIFFRKIKFPSSLAIKEDIEITKNPCIWWCD